MADGIAQTSSLFLVVWLDRDARTQPEAARVSLCAVYLLNLLLPALLLVRHATFALTLTPPGPTQPKERPLLAWPTLLSSDQFFSPPSWGVPPGCPPFSLTLLPNGIAAHRECGRQVFSITCICMPSTPPIRPLVLARSTYLRTHCAETTSTGAQVRATALPHKTKGPISSLSFPRQTSPGLLYLPPTLSTRYTSLGW